jgi:hypothetical protein
LNRRKINDCEKRLAAFGAEILQSRAIVAQSAGGAFKMS